MLSTVCGAKGIKAPWNMKRDGTKPARAGTKTETSTVHVLVQKMKKIGWEYILEDPVTRAEL